MLDSGGDGGGDGSDEDGGGGDGGGGDGGNGGGGGDIFKHFALATMSLAPSVTVVAVPSTLPSNACLQQVGCTSSGKAKQLLAISWFARLAASWLHSVEVRG